MGAGATQWQMFQQISLYNEKLDQICRKGCFFKKHTDFKEMSCGICNIYKQCQWRREGLQTSRSSHVMIGACSAVTGTTSGLQQAGQDILKELLWCLKLWFYKAVGKDTGCTQGFMCFDLCVLFLVTVKGPTHLGNWKTLMDSHFLSTLPVLQGCAGVWTGDPCKGCKIRNTSHQSVKIILILSHQETLKGCICARLWYLSVGFWIIYQLESKLWLNVCVCMSVCCEEVTRLCLITEN